MTTAATVLFLPGHIEVGRVVQSRFGGTRLARRTGVWAADPTTGRPGRLVARATRDVGTLLALMGRQSRGAPAAGLVARARSWLQMEPCASNEPPAAPCMDDDAFIGMVIEGLTAFADGPGTLLAPGVFFEGTAGAALREGLEQLGWHVRPVGDALAASGAGPVFAASVTGVRAWVPGADGHDARVLGGWSPHAHAVAGGVFALVQAALDIGPDVLGRTAGHAGSLWRALLAQGLSAGAADASGASGAFLWPGPPVRAVELAPDMRRTIDARRAAGALPASLQALLDAHAEKAAAIRGAWRALGQTRLSVHTGLPTASDTSTTAKRLAQARLSAADVREGHALSRRDVPGLVAGGLALMPLAPDWWAGAAGAASAWAPRADSERASRPLPVAPRATERAPAAEQPPAAPQAPAAPPVPPVESPVNEPAPQPVTRTANHAPKASAPPADSAPAWASVLTKLRAHAPAAAGPAIDAAHAALARGALAAARDQAWRGPPTSRDVSVENTTAPEPRAPQAIHDGALDDAPVLCGRCFSRAARQDAYCAVCGAPLAALEAHAGLLGPGGPGASVKNTGSVPLAVVVRPAALSALPAWVAQVRLGDAEPGEAVWLEPDASVPVDIVARAAQDDTPIARIDVTAHARAVDGERLTRHTATVAIGRAGGVEVGPGALVYPVVDQGLHAHLEVRNKHGTSITVHAIEVEPGEGPVLQAEVMPGAPTVLKPGASLPITLTCAAGAMPGVLVAVVHVRTDAGDLRVPVCAGSFPRAAPAWPSAVVIRAAGAPAVEHITLENPSSTPLEVRAEVVPAASGTLDTRSPWLTLDEDVRLLGPGEAVRWALRVDPSARAPGTEEDAWAAATIRLSLGGSAADTHDIAVRAELGKQRAVLGAVLGVDFGTSHSTAVLHDAEDGVTHPLDLEPRAAGSTLRSLLFYQGQERPSPFLFGHAALHAAPLEWTNLVRSVKTVLRASEAGTWHFIEPGSGDVRTYDTTALVSAFLAAVKRRAERAVQQLPPAILSRLGVRDAAARFSHVVLTHPVGLSNTGLARLQDAASAAGLVPSGLSADVFRAQHCVDEAVAAALAWVDVWLRGKGGAPIQDDVRVLVCDMGGGTTDLALVRVSHAAAFAAGTQDHVDVALCGTAGLQDVGGDAVDRALAGHVLDALEGARVNVDVARVRRALVHATFDGFRRYEHGRAAGSAPELAMLRRAFGARSAVLLAAEAAKCALGDAEAAAISLDLRDWPTADAAVAPDVERWDTSVSRADLDTHMAETWRAVGARAVSLADAAGGAGALDVVLIVGQGARVHGFAVALRRALPLKPDAAWLRPDALPALDSKRCVARGAGVYGDSLAAGGWLRISHPAHRQLATALTRRLGPRFVPIAGLEAGTALPARASLDLGTPAQDLTVWQGGRPLFRARFATPVSHVELEVIDAQHARFTTPEGHVVDIKAEVDA